MKKILNNPYIEEMYNKQKGKFEELVLDNDVKMQKCCEDTLESARILYEFISKSASDKTVSEVLEKLVKKLSVSYDRELEETAIVYYKLGIFDGFNSQNELKDILGGECYEQ